MYFLKITLQQKGENGFEGIRVDVGRFYEFILLEQERYDSSLDKDIDSKNGKKQIYFRDICDMESLRLL